MLDDTAGAHPNKPFILYPKRLTFGELNALVDRLATALLHQGVKKGDVVGLQMWNTPEWIISFFAILKTGATVTPMNPTYKGREVRYQLEDSGAVAVIVDEESYMVLKTVRGELRGLRDVIVVGGRYPDTRSFEELLKTPPNLPELKINPSEDLAVIQYTGTSEGVKGCMLTHSNLVSNTIQYSSMPGLEFTSTDVVLAHLPFYHIYGLMANVCTPVRMGMSIVIQKRFEIEKFLELVERFRCTFSSTVMPVITFLSSYPELLQRRDLSSVRFIQQAAMPSIPEIVRKFQKLTGIQVIQAYGLSEASPFVAVNPLSQSIVDSIGPPLPDTQIKIVDPETGTRELPTAVVGEIIVRGPQVMKGYWRRPKETAKVLRGGWLYTGDLGRRDANGYLYFVDRKKEIIKYMGFTVSPAELESVLRGHPAVDDCAVVGKPDPVAGEIPKAFVKLREGAEIKEEELYRLVGSNVAGYKKIREIELVDYIPRSPEGMLQRKKLLKKERMRASTR